ncbi:MAG: hypothetical protein JRH06_09195 [Deltaproteobacteria bacterium]|nr:hypothetical protein [Deltaproteobacteria bacterium]MBW2137720.1 hypothetical protein [Deltaproteobacteria bacterium]
MKGHETSCYTVGIEIAVGAERAFQYLSDLEKLGLWALGCFDTKPSGKEGLYKGRSLFDGSEVFVRTETDEGRLLIDYYVGGPERQIPRIFTRVVPGHTYGGGPDHCLVIMTAWRTKDMSDPRWRRLCASHDAEILMIQSQLERQSPCP